jgi:hypothetical protein
MSNDKTEKGPAVAASRSVTTRPDVDDFDGCPTKIHKRPPSLPNPSLTSDRALRLVDFLEAGLCSEA